MHIRKSCCDEPYIFREKGNIFKRYVTSLGNNFLICMGIRSRNNLSGFKVLTGITPNQVC